MMLSYRLTFNSAKSFAAKISSLVSWSSQYTVAPRFPSRSISVQNVIEVKARGGDYVFTTPPSLVRLSKSGGAMFKGKEDPKFQIIRALFPIPSLTMHFVMSKKVA